MNMTQGGHASGHGLITPIAASKGYGSSRGGGPSSTAALPSSVTRRRHHNSGLAMAHAGPAISTTTTNASATATSAVVKPTKLHLPQFSMDDGDGIYADNCVSKTSMANNNNNSNNGNNNNNNVNNNNVTQLDETLTYEASGSASQIIAGSGSAVGEFTLDLSVGDVLQVHE